MTIQTGGSNNVFHNNDFYSDEGFQIRVLGVDYDSLAAWQATGLEVDSISQNPNLTNNIPNTAIAEGENLGSTYEDGLDISTDWGDENTLPVVVTKKQTGTWQIGAYIQ